MIIFEVSDLTGRYYSYWHICYATVGCDNEYYITSWCYVLLLPVCETKFCGTVRLTSINIQKKILKNPVFKSTIFFLDVY
jgi:hypothetical protein